MNGRAVGRMLALIWVVSMGPVGCGTVGLPRESGLVKSSVGVASTVPSDVQRLAVFYPRSSNPDYNEAYQQLEGAVFQLKGQRPSLRIVDRFHLPILRSEQQLQYSGSVTDDSAVRIGRVLGVDSVLLYAIDGPTIRERLFAGRPGHLRPVTVTTKIVRVETAEVIFHNVVSARMDEGAYAGWSLSDSMDLHQLGREALDCGIQQTVSDLRQAFQ